MMQHEFGLHELAVEDARHGHQRPKIEEYGETLFAVMHTVELASGELQRRRGRRLRRAATTCCRCATAASRASWACARAPSASRTCCSHGVGFVLLRADGRGGRPLLPDHRRARDRARNDRGADLRAAASARANIERLYELKRKVTHRQARGGAAARGRRQACSGRVPQVCASNREYFRDVYDHLARINASLDAMRDTIGTAIQVNLSMVTIEETEITKRLAAWAGIFAVATAFAGIWGMNFEHMPELKWTWGYPAALGVIARLRLRVVALQARPLAVTDTSSHERRRPDPDALLAARRRGARRSAASCASTSAPPPASARPGRCWPRRARAGQGATW